MQMIKSPPEQVAFIKLRGAIYGKFVRQREFGDPIWNTCTSKSHGGKQEKFKMHEVQIEFMCHAQPDLCSYSTYSELQILRRSGINLLYFRIVI